MALETPVLLVVRSLPWWFDLLGFWIGVSTLVTILVVLVVIGYCDMSD